MFIFSRRIQDKYKLQEDKNRTDILNMLGLKVIRFKNEEVEENINYVLEKIKEELITHPNPSLKKRRTC